MLANPPLLKLPDFSRPFVLSTDASSYAVGAVLAQDYEGREHPIAFASRVLSPTETKYSVIEKELLAIVFGVKRFRPFLYGQPFVVYCDHNPLQHISSLKDSHGRIARLRRFLADYNCDVRYRPGKDNWNADCISRRLTISAVEEMDLDYHRLLNGEPIRGKIYYEGRNGKSVSRQYGDHN
jgi:hypothetical protein